MEASPAQEGGGAGARAGTHGRGRYALVAGAAVVALVLALTGAVLSPTVSLLVTVAMVLTIAWGWPAATGVAAMRGRKRLLSHSALIAGCGLLSCLVVYLFSIEELLYLLPAVVAVGVLLCFIVELVRGEGARGRLESVISAAAGVLAAVSSSGWIGMATVHSETSADAVVWGTGVVIAACIGLVGGRMIWAGPRDGPRRGAITLGVTPVAFFGTLGYAGTFFLLAVLG
ncbi:hypothetical protein [Rothia halotolerans]|uniref:hypothetical protein n=1 Tax=Rothia halotolerans TaxID=405770 RepID=UPI001EE09FC9|nr:hypothetical protein [Rothia halotolerans]